MKSPIFVKFEMANEFVNLFFEEIYRKPQYNGHAKSSLFPSIPVESYFLKPIRSLKAHDKDYLSPCYHIFLLRNISLPDNSMRYINCIECNCRSLRSWYRVKNNSSYSSEGVKWPLRRMKHFRSLSKKEDNDHLSCVDPSMIMCYALIVVRLDC